jgi:hypothetical protein
VSRVRASLTVLAAVSAVAVAVQAVAVAASVPLPLTEKAYSTPGYVHNVSVDLVTNARNPKVIQAGPAPLASQFFSGGIYAHCPGVPRNHGLPPSDKPFAGIAFPAITLKLSHGHYGFSKRLKFNQFLLGSSLGKPVKLSVLFSGTVASSKLIKGTVKITGSHCATTANYAAKLSNAAVAPGA